jgi:phosphoribosylformylglycinamidine (FGAM) synthase-like enzyme
VALAEMAMASGIGARLDPPRAALPHAFWFGEDQGCYVITVPARHLAEVEARAGLSACRLGMTGGDALTLPGERPVLLKELSARFEDWLPAYMAGADS